MNIQQKLIKELINYTFSNLGLVPDPLWGKAGISEDIFKTNKVVKIQSEDDIFEFPIYSATCNIGQDKVNILALKMDDGDYVEFALVFRMNDLPIFGLKQIVDGNEGQFLITDKGENWINPGMYDKLTFCAGIEKITDQGIGWSPGNLDLFNYLLKIVEI